MGLSKENKHSDISSLSLDRNDFLSRVNQSSAFLHRELSFPTFLELQKAYSIFSVLAQSSCLCCLNSGFTEVRFSCPSLKTEKATLEANLLTQQNLSLAAVDSAAKHWVFETPCFDPRSSKFSYQHDYESLISSKLGSVTSPQNLFSCPHSMEQEKNRLTRPPTQLLFQKRSGFKTYAQF